MLIFNSHSILSNSIALVCGKLNSPYFEGRSCKWKTDFDYSHVLFSYIYFFSSKGIAEITTKVTFWGKIFVPFFFSHFKPYRHFEEIENSNFYSMFWLEMRIFSLYIWVILKRFIWRSPSDEMEYIHPETSTALLSLTRKLFSSIHFVTIIGIN